MYDPGRVSATTLRTGHLVPGCLPLFDRDYDWVRPRPLPFRTEPFPSRAIQGGPRLRPFYPERRGRRMVRRNLRRAAELAGMARSAPSALLKVPMIRWRPGTAFLPTR
jgi:hypothetical protein